MGIRLKILLAFIFCFGLCGGIGLWVLRQSMSESYEAIERQEIIASMARVEQSFEAGAASLRSQTNDWAVWSEMHDFALKPDAEWARINLGEEVLKPAELSLLIVIARDGRLLAVTKAGPLANEAGHGQGVLSPQTEAYLGAFMHGEREVRCGLVRIEAGGLLVCWAGIVRSDASGEVAGTVVMGRLLDAARIGSMRAQTRMSFDMRLGEELPPGLTPWAGMLEGGAIGGGDFWTSFEPNVYHVYYRLQDILRQDVGLISLDVSRSVHQQGERLFRQVRWQLVATILVMTGLLAAALNFLLIHRLRRLAAELDDLAAHSDWDRQVNPGGRDELGLVADNVNRLLTVIRSQVGRLSELSRTDGMTGLYNRRAFDERLTVECQRARRAGEPLTLLLVDVDYFKRYNDCYGHPAGDSALKAVGSILAGAVHRPSDIAARIGGEEFALLLPETDLDGALEVAELIRKSLSQMDIAHARSPIDTLLTLSIGIALLGSESASLFMRRADRALYAAKEAGRNRVVCDDPGHVDTARIGDT